MGTNYYAIPKASNLFKDIICKKIKEEDFDTARKLIPSKVHIGKNSYGWRFIFNHNNWEHFTGLQDLKLFLRNCIIKDEYDREITNDEFWEMVKNSENQEPYLENGKEYFGLIFCDYTEFS